MKRRENDQIPFQAPISPDKAGYVAYMIVPPNGGYGWIIVLISFLGCVIVDGIAFSFSLFRAPIADSLSVTSTEVAAVNSVFIGIYFFGGIVSCGVANRYGFRIVMMIGSLLLIGSYAVTGTLTNIITMYIIFGFIGGVGAGLVSMCIVLPPGFYFDKKRPIAMGLSASGTGVGAICVPPVIEYCVNSYGWRNSFFIEAGIMVFLIIIALLLRPLEPIKVNLKINENYQDTDSIVEQFMYSTLPDAFSLRSLVTLRSIRNENDISEYPTLSTIAETTGGNIVLENAPPEMIPRLQQMTSPRIPTRDSARTREITSISRLPSQPRKTLVKRVFQSQHTTGARPLYRTDALYHGSLMRLDEYTDKDREIEYHLDVTQPATQRDIDEEKERKCIMCPEAVKRGISAFISFKLLKSPIFLCLASCGLLNYFSFYVPFLYIGESASAKGLDGYKTILIVMIGVGLTMGRIISGIVITIFPNFSALECTVLTCTISGLSVIASTLYKNVTYQMVCMVTYGFAAGIFSPLRSIIIVDLMGLQNLTTASGMLIFFQGIGSMAGPPTADLIKNVTQDHNAPFYIAGACFLVSSCFLLPVKFFKKRERYSISL